ncbi:autotransporter outer membrane beta-barrel domain-containing protein [Yersinia enterocolitica]|uniref:autotransporter outer membrane beta-barrel domain-containing protein n=1 Tax=Yersinia enterocolitica TaxID=630 RepID=UPI000B0BCD3B|nr:autotransporter outer membrane beta-barrel domain-containing protein [Yersinia enterocolitica]
MYISNIIQPNGHAKNISSNDARYRLSPCAKAISALLLVFSSTVAWADDKAPILDTPMTVTPPPSLIPGQYIPPQREIPSDPVTWGDGHRPDNYNSHKKIPPAPIIIHISNMLEAGTALLEASVTGLPEDISVLNFRKDENSHKKIPPAPIISHVINMLEAGTVLTEAISELNSRKDDIAAYRKELARVIVENEQHSNTLLPSKLIASATQHSKITPLFSNPLVNELRLIGLSETKRIDIQHIQMLDKLYDEEIEKEKALVRKITKPLNNIVPTAVVNDVYQEIESVFDDATIKAVAAEKAAAEKAAVEKAAAEKAAAEKAAAEKAAAEKAAAEKAAAEKVAAEKVAPIIGHNPQVGSYIANQIAAQQMFITDDLQYRLGETRYIDPVTGEEKVSSLWINTSAAKNRFNSGNGQLRIKSNRYAIQLGGTVNKWSSGGDDQGILGVTAGLGKSTNHSHSTSSHHQAQGSVDGYNLGLYSIWYADNHTRLGPYIDLLAQYGWFNNQIKAPNVTTAANYKSYLFTSALETGYKIQLFETADTKLSLQPRAKVMWQRTSGLLHKEPNAILINVEEDNAVTTKLGMRTVLEFDIDTLSSAKSLQISPSFEANWIHSRVNQGVQLSRAYTSPQRVQDKIELASVNVSPQGNKNIADLKLGIEANIDSNLRLWTYLGHQFGGHNYSDTQATVGMNYRF